jgi:glycosyltransferase involved in cell wall biosynthesis
VADVAGFARLAPRLDVVSGLNMSIGRILFFPRETYPTDRVRLNTLFGQELLTRGHSIDLVMHAADPGVPTGLVPWHGGQIRVLPARAAGSIVSRARRVFQGVMQDLRALFAATSNAYDTILVSDKFLLGAVAATVARVRGQSFLFWLTFPYHEADVEALRTRRVRFPILYGIRGFLTQQLLWRLILPRTDHLLVQSEAMARGFAARGIPMHRMTPIVTGVDLEGVEPRHLPRTRSSREPLTVVYLGTLVRNRRLEVLVEMIPFLNRHGVRIQLLLVGDSAKREDREMLERRASELHVSSQVRITGFLPRPEALRLVRDADIGISPFYPSSVLDVASPTKLIEYLALGLPVVANSHPEQSVILRESRAGVRTPWGARHFARAIIWLSRRTDHELQRMAARGIEWTEANRSYTSIADRFEAACIEARRTAASSGRQIDNRARPSR